MFRRFLLFVVLLSVSSSAFCDANVQSKLAPFWQQAELGAFTGTGGIKIVYGIARVAKPTATLVLLPGRSEPFIKYIELVKFFNAQGFTVFTMDHRGQGLSARILEDSLKGHVEVFGHFSTDLQIFLEQIVLPQQQGRLLMLAHSMGGAIALQSLAESGAAFDAVALSAPMIEAELGFPAGCAIAELIAFFCAECWTPRSRYDSDDAAFADNRLTHSRERFIAYRQLLREVPEAKLDAPTYAWVKAACRSRGVVLESAAGISSPVLLLQAELEQLVINEAQNRFCKGLNKQGGSICAGGTPVQIKGARHELLFEQDEYRDQALDLIMEYYQAP